MQDLHWRYNFHTDQFDFIENNVNQTYQPLLQNVTVPTLVIDINLVDSKNLSRYYYDVLDKCLENNIVYSQIIFEHTQDPVLDYPEKCNILEDLSKTSGIKSYFAHVRFNAVQHQHLSEIVYPNQIILHRRRGRPPLPADRKHGFSCLNRNPSMHRLLFYTLIKQANLLDKFIFTFYDRCPYNGFKYGPNQYRQLRSFIDEELYNQCLINLDDFPLSWLEEVLGGNNDHTFTHAAFADTWCNIVTETSVFCPYASEKIWKPIASGQIFLAVAHPFMLGWLKSFGFHVFDEQYDVELDLLKRITMVVDTIKKHSKDPRQWWMENKFSIEHNYYLFHSGNVERQILDPLVSQLNCF